jgi:hypothetical protein
MLAFNTTEDFKQNTNTNNLILPLHFSHNTDYKFSIHLFTSITVTLYCNADTMARMHKTCTVSRGWFTVKLIRAPSSCHGSGKGPKLIIDLIPDF